MKVRANMSRGSYIGKEAAKLKECTKQNISAVQWGQLTKIKNTWGKKKLDYAINAFIKCDKPDKNKFMVAYLWAVCRNAAILTGEIKSAGTLEEILGQDRSMEEF